jgi:hypothetical protein
VADRRPQSADAGDTGACWRHAKALGFAGSYALVRGYVERHRVRPDPAAPTPPTVRQVTGWLTRHPKTLTEDEQPLLKRSWSGAQSCGQPPVTSAPSASCSRGSVARSCPGGSPPCAPTAYPACRGLPPAWSTTSTRWPAA